MKAVLVAVKSKFVISGLSLYMGAAPQTESIPYAIYNLINGAPDERRSTFTTDSEDIEIQFSIYAATASQALDYQTALQALYDNSSLAVTGYEPVIFKRVLSTLFPDDDNYQAVSTYKILTDKE